MRNAAVKVVGRLDAGEAADYRINPKEREMAKQRNHSPLSHSVSFGRHISVNALDNLFRR